jgi:phospholipase C
MPLQHIFVLMLENRSYDHMLGFSPIGGRDAETGADTMSRGLDGTEFNTVAGESYPVVSGADWVMPLDPAHEFQDVFEQLCGPDARFTPGAAFPPIDDSGYAASYVASGGGTNPGEIMKCYAPDQLPVLNALAREFVLCDNWHASLPGPTWPNRMFVHGASSAGLDHSPSVLEIVQWEALSGFTFPNGDIFDLLQRNGITRRLYGGDDFPMVSALKGIGLDDIRRYEHFADDLLQDSFPYSYVFIEPSYDVFHEYRAGNSQHPLGDVRRGEALIKSTYEVIRNSPHWSTSMLIVTWDEHGGFYDHAVPPQAVPPGDSTPFQGHNQTGFTFNQYGPRVPAVVISPLIPKNVIDHRVYDHASVPATLEKLFGLPALTDRDRSANSLTALATLDKARSDTPESLPGAMEAAVSAAEAAAVKMTSPSVVRPDDTVNQGNLPAMVHAAMQQHLKAAPELRGVILRRVEEIKTRADAREYLLEARQATRSAKAASLG